MSTLLRRMSWVGDGKLGGLLDELKRLGGEVGVEGGVEVSGEVATHSSDAQEIDPNIKTKQYPLGEYKGYFLADKRHGKGELLYKDFDYYFPKRYDGDWENDKIQGRGVMEYNDNSMYSGYWKNGVREGEGTLFFNNGEPITDVDGKILTDKHGIKKYKNSDTYIGCWDKDMRVGQGLMIFKNKNEYNGVWKSDKFSEGTYTNNREDWSFTGTFDDVYPKSGTLTYSENEKTLQIHSENWRRVSIHDQKPVSLGIKPIEIQKTHATDKKSTMNDYFQKILKCASDIYDEVDLWLEEVEDKQARKPSGFGARGRYTH